MISMAAIVSGWRLFIAFVRGGAKNLQEKHIFWWWILLEGVLLIIASWIIYLLPDQPEYSTMWRIRIDFYTFIFASPCSFQRSTSPWRNSYENRLVKLP